MIRAISRYFAIAWLPLFGFAGAANAQAFDPSAALGQMITAFQHCGPPQVYQTLSPQMFELVAVQTGGSGCYGPIASAGPIIKMQVLQQAQFPIGPLYLIRVFHQAGPVDWFIGFNRLTGKIEYLSFQPAQGTPTISSGPAPSAGGPGTGAQPPAQPNPNPPTTGGGPQPEECDMYPTMCQ